MYSCARGRIKTASWDTAGIDARVAYRGIGQEFIFDTADHEAAASQWLAKIFHNAPALA
jgi:hypothetical protein